MTTRTRLRAAVLALALILALTACDSEAETTSSNLSQAADNFEVTRRITFVRRRAARRLQGRRLPLPDRLQAGDPPPRHRPPDQRAGGLR